MEDLNNIEYTKIRLEAENRLLKSILEQLLKIELIPKLKSNKYGEI